MANPPQPTIHFVSLGCPKNRVDTEVMLGVSDDQQYQHVSDPNAAQVIVINTCGFIDAAKQESIDTILEMARLKQDGNCQKLVVTGCLSQRYGAELAQSMPEVDHFLGTGDMLKLKDILKASDLKSIPPRMLIGNPAEHTLSALDPRRLSQYSYSAYLKIAEGCSRACSFCAIPSFRGKQRSRSIDDLYAEAKRLTEQGVVELNLISQDTVSYGRDLKERGQLVELIKRLGELDHLRWLRVFYLYPEKLSDELFELFASHPKVVPYIDMPLQHASDNMLTRMRRGHGGERLYTLVERMREKIPNMTFRSAFIVGHPGETEADFSELQKFIEWAKFDRLAVFAYSHEEGTHAGAMTDLVAPDVIEARYHSLMQTQQTISRTKNKTWVGKDIDVLIEGESEESEFLLEGRHAGQAPEIDGKVIITLPARKQITIEPGTFAKVHITKSADYDLVGRLQSAAGNTNARKHLRVLGANG